MALTLRQWRKLWEIHRYEPMNANTSKSAHCSWLLSGCTFQLYKKTLDLVGCTQLHLTVCSHCNSDGARGECMCAMAQPWLYSCFSSINKNCCFIAQWVYYNYYHRFVNILIQQFFGYNTYIFYHEVFYQEVQLQCKRMECKFGLGQHFGPRSYPTVYLIAFLHSGQNASGLSWPLHFRCCCFAVPMWESNLIYPWIVFITSLVRVRLCQEYDNLKPEQSSKVNLINFRWNCKVGVCRSCDVGCDFWC